MKIKTIRQTVTFNATPIEVYNLIMDAKKHGAFTGGKVEMSKEVDGKFRVFDGYCHGYNIDLVAGKKIVQAWNFAEDGWPDTHFSFCTFVFKQIGDKTKLSFTQKDVPDHKFDALCKGWKENYWEPMKEFLMNN